MCNSRNQPRRPPWTTI